MRITIIVVTLNSGKYISRCIESIISQSYHDIQILVKDGGSVDNTLELLANYPEIKLIVSEDNGIYDAMNQAVPHVDGDILTFLNSDDYFTDGMVLQRISRVFSDGDVDFSYSDVEFINDQQVKVRSWYAGDVTTKNLRVGYQVPHPGMFFRTNFWRGNDLRFNKNLKISADFELQQLLFSNKQTKFRYISEPIVTMQVGGTSNGTINAHFSGFIECVSILYKYWSLYGLLFSFRRYLSKINLQHFLFKIYFMQCNVIKIFVSLKEEIKSCLRIIKFYQTKESNNHYILGLPKNIRERSIIDSSGIRKGDYYLINKQNRRCITSLSLKYPKRFGNLYVQLANMITIAQINKIEVIYLPDEMKCMQFAKELGIKAKYYNTANKLIKK